MREEVTLLPRATRKRRRATEGKNDSKRQILTKKWHFLVFSAVSLVSPLLLRRVPDYY